MTAQEALRIRNNPCFGDVDNKALSKCIDESLEKQIPKKPIGVTGVTDPFFGDTTIIVCPTCKNANLANLFNRSMVYDYCPNCGQSLD